MTAGYGSHTFNPSTEEEKASGSVQCTKTTWSMDIVQGQPGLWRNLVSKKQNYIPQRVDQNWTKMKAGIEDESITGKSACPGRCLAARGHSLIISH